MWPDGLTDVVRTLVVGVLAYGAVVLIVRLSGKRTLSKWNAFDLIVTVALGSSLASTVLSKDVSLTEGVLGIALLVVLQWCITRLAVRSRMAERWVKARPRLLLLHGELQHDALRKERVTESEVRAALRSQGLSSLDDVDAIVLETDGSFSVVRQLGSSDSALADVVGYPGRDPGASRPA